MIHRAPREEARERAKSREGTPDFKRSKKLRMRVERLFADIKHNDGFRRVRLRGRRGADEQFVLAATARNLKRMITLLSNARGQQEMAGVRKRNTSSPKDGIDRPRQTIGFFNSHV